MLTLLLLPLKALHWEEYQLLGRMRPVIFFCPFYLPINKSCSTTAAIFYKLEKIGLPKKCLEFFKLCSLRPFCNAKSHAVKNSMEITGFSATQILRENNFCKFGLRIFKICYFDSFNSAPLNFRFSEFLHFVK